MKKLIYILVFTFLLSCDKNEVDCSAVSCLEAGIIVNLIDDASKESFLLSNMIDKATISIQNSSALALDFNIDKNTGILIIQKPSNTDTVKISIEPDTNLLISFDTSLPTSNDCCDFGELINLQIENKVFEIIDGVITIYV
ncbi:hypothetical protein SAMN05421824_1783 [Hyunsoonleella jejuensis]|uniref:Uncharacterized protein n=1 Tax=Hyunsoonleella jejuensis TaxID=419940 RepID=A0A1H9GFC2_9FLAO|nr:hypothetical protein [Hyunsoonleella jejuensis]SEQ48764.1 hypothetical protein SAMN05421824_1783 [Hyunsoonleella jejuensis]